MLSFRHALQLWPRTLRFLVFALALVQFVAPTWHICELGGSAPCSSMPSMQRWATSGSAGPRQTLICYCAPRPQHHSGEATLSPTADSADHVNCLALLLQSLPGHFAASPALFVSSDAIDAQFAIREESPVTATISHFRGRAPPLDL